MGKRNRQSSFHEVSYERGLWPRAASLIKKETDERRTSNIERSISNNVFYLLNRERAKCISLKQFDSELLFRVALKANGLLQAADQLNLV